MAIGTALAERSALAPAEPVDTDFPGQPDQPGPDIVLLVKKKGPENEVADFHRRNGVKVTKFKRIKWDAVDIPKGQAAKILRKYKDSPLFDKVEFQRTYTTNAIPNDPLYAQQWALPKIEAPSAWDKATSNNVVVAVMDTGIDFTHPDLQANLWTGPQGQHGYTAINGIITDGGFDDHFHGTHVAGTIGAVANNGIGVAGINWRTKLASFKFIGPNGQGFTRDAILCLEKIIDLKLSGQNIRVANHSWGGFGDDPALQDAFAEVSKVGVLNVCAAGNDNVNTDERQFIPAGFPIDGIISILSSDQSDQKSFFSNYGAASTDIFAPGSAILSTKPGGDYWQLSGTSMATPHVAGALAMLFGMNPTLTIEQARTILLQPQSYDKIPFTLNSTDGGRLNLSKLWTNPAITNPPPANIPPVLVSPTNFYVVPSTTTVPIGVTATSGDNDPLSYSYAWLTHDLPWFLQSVMGGEDKFNGTGNTNVLLLTGKSLALDQSVKINFSVTDGRGGSDSTKIEAFTIRDDTKRYNLESAITGFRFWNDATNQPWFRLDMSTNYPAFDSVRFDVRISGGGGVILRSPCCHEPNVTHKADGDFNPGTYSVRAWVADKYGNSVSSPVSQYFVSNSTLRPPVVKMTLNTTRGMAPLNVIADMSATVPGDATKLYYMVVPLHGSTVTMDIFNPVRRFTLNEPGTYVLQFTAADYYQWIADTVIGIFTVLPGVPPKLAMTHTTSGVVLSWTGGGILQESTLVSGPWIDSQNQDNPQSRSSNSGSQFFRTR